MLEAKLLIYQGKKPKLTKHLDMKVHSEKQQLLWCVVKYQQFT